MVVVLQKEALMVNAGDEGWGGNGKVLVMDDEEVVHAVSGEMLRLLGYTAEFAFDGEEAIKKYTEALNSGEPYSAVIMDLTIPGGMGGKEAVGKLLKVHPAIKAVVSSGYSSDPVMSDYKRFGFCAVLPKPYRVSEFDKVMKGVLSKRH